MICNLVSETQIETELGICSINLNFFEIFKMRDFMKFPGTVYTCDLSPPNFSNLNTLVLMSAAYRRC